MSKVRPHSKIAMLTKAQAEQIAAELVAQAAADRTKHAFVPWYYLSRALLALKSAERQALLDLAKERVNNRISTVVAMAASVLVFVVVWALTGFGYWIAGVSVLPYVVGVVLVRLELRRSLHVQRHR
jgi:hypothetical protein